MPKLKWFVTGMAIGYLAVFGWLYYITRRYGPIRITFVPWK